MQLSNTLKLIIAKSDYEHKKWLPLWVHAQDTANVFNKPFPCVSDVQDYHDQRGEKGKDSGAR